MSEVVKPKPRQSVVRLWLVSYVFQQWLLIN